MQFRFSNLISAIVFAGVTLPVAAGSLDPTLQGIVDAGNTSGSGDVPVIIHFERTADRAALRREARRRALALFPGDPRMQRKAFRRFKRRLLIDALKTSSRDSGREVRLLLRSHGEPRPLKVLWLRNSVVVSVPAHLLDEIAALPGVDRVVLDATIQGPGDGTPPTAPTHWNLPATGVEQVWNTGSIGQDTVVATLDTGVDASHPEIGPRWRGGSNSWFDPHGQHTTPADAVGHGTRVIGLIVGDGSFYYQTGMAPGAQWISAKIFDDNNQSTLSAIHEAFQWVLDPDADPLTDDAPDFVNNSWALQTTVNQCNQEFQLDVALLKEAEIGVTFAGGNYGPDFDTSVSPGNDPAVTSVGGVDAQMNVDVQSSRGPGACDGGIYPRLVAPGDDVLTTDLPPNYYNWVSGTSFAVAHVTGAMAVLKSAFPDATVYELETALVETATDLGDPGPDNTYGNGLLDVAAAYDWLVALAPDPGAFTFSTATYGIDENVAMLDVTVTRSDGSDGEVSVDYATADGSATAGEDYVASSGTLIFVDGETSASFQVILLDDSVYEGDEDLSLTLSNPLGGAWLGTLTHAVVVLRDDDPDPASGAPTANADAATVVAGLSVEIAVLGNDSDPEGDPISIEAASAASVGTASCPTRVVDAVCTYNAVGVAAGTIATFDYTATDGNFSSNLATVTVTVIENQVPTANPDVTSAVVGDGAVVIDVLANDSDPEAQPLKVVALDTTGTSGSVDCSAQTSCSYTPTVAGEDTFAYAVSDGVHTSSPAIVTVNVTSPNQGPIAVDDPGNLTVTDLTLTIDVLANDTDPESDPLAIASYTSTSAQGATVSCDTGVVGGTCTYTPLAGQTYAGDTFAYTVTDGVNISTPATVTVDVTASAAVKLYFSTEGFGAVPGVVGPYDDADLYTLDAAGIYERVLNAAYGPAVPFNIGLPGKADIDGVSIDGTIIYISFAATSTDVPGLGPVPDEDVVAYDTVSGIWSPYFDGSLCGLDANGGGDIDALSVDGRVLYFSTLNNFVVAGVGGSQFDDADVYTWSEGAASCGRALDVRGAGVVNLLPPTADLDGLTVIGGTYYLSFHGDVTLDGTINAGVDGPATPMMDEAVVSFVHNGGDRYTWTVVYANDPALSGDSGQNVDAIHVVTVPIAVDDPGNLTVTDLTLTIDVLANDTDPESDPLAIASYTSTSAQGATVSCDTGVVGGTCTYTPLAGQTYAGDTFAYMVTDGVNISTPATVTVDVTASAAVKLYFSTEGFGAVPGVVGPYDDADLYTLDAAGIYERVLNAAYGPAVPFNIGLPGKADIDGVSIDGTIIYISFAATSTDVPGLGPVPDEDVVAYDTVSGIWSPYFDGSLCGLDANGGGDIDALSVDGRVLYFSTLNNFVVAGVGGSQFDDADVYTWSEGAASCGRALDVRGAGVVNLLPPTADLDGLTVIGGTYYLSFHGDVTLDGTINAGVDGPATPMMDEAVVSFVHNGGYRYTWSVVHSNDPALSSDNGQNVDAIHVIE